MQSSSSAGAFPVALFRFFHRIVWFCAFPLNWYLNMHTWSDLIETLSFCWGKHSCHVVHKCFPRRGTEKHENWQESIPSANRRSFDNLWWGTRSDKHREFHKHDVNTHHHHVYDIWHEIDFSTWCVDEVDDEASRFCDPTTWKSSTSFIEYSGFAHSDELSARFFCLGRFNFEAIWKQIIPHLVLAGKLSEIFPSNPNLRVPFPHSRSWKGARKKQKKKRFARSKFCKLFISMALFISDDWWVLELPT